jgi:hypothetical protein
MPSAKRVVEAYLSRDASGGWEDLSRRLRRELGSPWEKFEVEDLKEAAEQGELVVDLRSSENDPRVRKLGAMFPEIEWTHGWDYGSMHQKEWFLTGTLKDEWLRGQ